jgi:neutral ceramidase
MKNNNVIYVLLLFVGAGFMALTTDVMAGQFSAGFATSDISPKKGEQMLTILNGPKLTDRIDDPILVKALVLSDGKQRLAMVVVDAIALYESNFNTLFDVLYKQHHFDYVTISVTHTHSGFFSEERALTLNQTIIDTLLVANKHLTPVKIGAAKTSIDESYNRIVHKTDGVEMLWTNPQRIKTRPVDNTLSILHFKTLDEQPFLTWVFYNAHPVVTMALNEVVISADYPGQMAKVIKQKLGSDVLFSLGAAGDVNPYDANTTPVALSMVKSAELGGKLANVALGAINSIKDYQCQGQFSFVSKQFSQPDASVGVIMLTSSIGLAHFPGEYFDDFAVQLRQSSPFNFTMFMSMTNGNLGYVPTAQATEKGGYGAELSQLKVKKNTGQQHVDYAVKSLKVLHKGSP